MALVDGAWDFKVGTLTAFSFVVGGVTSMVSGYIGMMIAVFTNARCTMVRGELSGGVSSVVHGPFTRPPAHPPRVSTKPP